MKVSKDYARLDTDVQTYSIQDLTHTDLVRLRTLLIRSGKVDVFCVALYNEIERHLQLDGGALPLLCPASGAGCAMGPYGPDGATQCRYCGDSPA